MPKTGVNTFVQLFFLITSSLHFLLLLDIQFFSDHSINVLTISTELSCSFHTGETILVSSARRRRGQKLLGKVSLHWDDGFRWDSIFTYAKQLCRDYVESSNFTPRIPFQLGTGLFIIWELIQSNLFYTDTGGSYMSKVSVLSRLKLRAIFSKEQSKLSVMMNFPY